MSFYRRFISYMYDTSDTSKRKNCGFVKVEVRGNKCTFLFQLKSAPCQRNCKIYLCSRDKTPEYIFLKELLITNGNACYKIDTHSQKMVEHDLTFEQCCGILCIDENGKQCGTCWDKIGTLPEYKKLQSVISVPEEPPVTEELIEETDCSVEQETSPAEDSLEPIAEPVTEPATPSHPKTFPEVWEHLQKEFTPMDPFEDDAIVETIKISPSDLGYLQSFNLNLGSNQFLLHGYKSYHHLLLGRLHGQNQYILGIPGVYDPQEQFMAKMFGFPCFKPIRECRQKNGQFGYWMKCFRS